MIEIDGVQIVMNSEVELSLRQEIMEKVSFILSVLKGTIPMNREVGIDPDVISAPAYQAQNLYSIPWPLRRFRQKQVRRGSTLP